MIRRRVSVHREESQEEVGNELANVEGHGPIEGKLAVDHLHALTPLLPCMLSGNAIHAGETHTLALDLTPNA